jgi:hypothetical protein
MSEQGDLAGDLRLAEALGRLPAPAIPPGLAERIARNATRLPQLHDPEQHGRTAAEPPAAPAHVRPVRSRRWFPAAAAGSAIAATLAIAWLQAPDGSDRQNSAPVIARNNLTAPAGPAAAPPPVLVEAHDPTPATPAPRPESAAATKSGPAVPVPPDDAPRLARDGPSDAPTDAVPDSAAPPAVAVAVPQVRSTEQELMGPPDLDDTGEPMAQPGSNRELGISGAGAPDLSVPSPAPRGQSGGRGARGMPRF